MLEIKLYKGIITESNKLEDIGKYEYQCRITDIKDNTIIINDTNEISLILKLTQYLINDRKGIL